MRGRYGVVAPVGTARPTAVSTPRERARATSSRANRDLPIPASPVMQSTPPCPERAAPSA